jgi:hypothetical protein
MRMKGTAPLLAVVSALFTACNHSSDSGEVQRLQKEVERLKSARPSASPVATAAAESQDYQNFLRVAAALSAQSSRVPHFRISTGESRMSCFRQGGFPLRSNSRQAEGSCHVRNRHYRCKRYLGLQQRLPRVTSLLQGGLWRLDGLHNLRVLGLRASCTGRCLQAGHRRICGHHMVLQSL